MWRAFSNIFLAKLNCDSNYMKCNDKTKQLFLKLCEMFALRF